MDAPPTILIVEDEPDVLEYLETLIGTLGYRTIRARHGREALERVAETTPDLILSDVVMPVMDGISLCRTLKADAATRLVPVIIMTALSGIDDRVRGIEAGADDYLTKPVDHRELIARVQTALKLRQAMDAKLVELSRARDHLAKFAPDAVRRLVAANPVAPALDKAERDLSVLFVDVSGYVRLAAEVPADALNAIIERYFSRFLARIQEGGGDINETAGDGFMAVFLEGAPAGHAAEAVDAALGILDLTAELNRDAAHPLAVHLGLNSGAGLVGSTRLAGPRGDRWTFTASGPVTNLAARLAQAARAGEILAGPETVQRVADRFVVEAVERRALRGINEGVVLHRVVGRRDPATAPGGA
jgi:DNA-binding response OmpR family regulator